MESQRDNINSTITEDMMQCFWDLASIDSSVRVEATMSLLAILQNLEPADSKGSRLSESSLPLDKAIEGCHPTVAYSLKRLCKGLASSRKAARQGFALALTTLLQEIPSLNDGNTIGLILQSFKSYPARTADRDVYFGHILGLGSILRIKSIGPDVCLEVIEQALWLSKEKSFLHEAAMLIILEIMEKKSHEIAQACFESKMLQAWLGTPWQESTPEALAVSLRLWHLMPSHVIEHCSLLPSLDRKPSEKLFKKGRSIKNRTDNLAAMAVFEEENLKKYLPALRKVVQESTALHPAWICLLTLLLPGIDLSWLNDFSPSVRYLGPSRISPEVTELNFFWNLLIEDGVFNAKSMERLSQGFLIADKIVKCVDARFLKFLLTPNFLRALSKHSSRRDSFLYSISSQFIETCANLMQDMDSATKAMMANAFRKYSISGLKDPLGAQPMHLTEERQDPEISVRIRKLQKEIESAFESLDDEKIDRQESIIGLLVEEARNLSLSPNLVAEILTFLAGQIIYKDSVEEGLSDHRLTASFIAAFDSIMRSRLRKGTDPVRHAECKFILDQLMSHCDKLSYTELEPKAYETSPHLGAVLKILRHLRRSIMSKFENEKAQSHKLYSILYFLSLAEFYMMANPVLLDVSMAYELQELLLWDLGIPRCKMNAEKHKIDSKRQKDPVNDQDDTINAFVEAFLRVITFNFAPLPSAPIRDAVEHLFRIYSPHVTENGVVMLTNYVVSHLVSSEANEGSEDDDNDDDDDDDDDDEEEEAAASIDIDVTQNESENKSTSEDAMEEGEECSDDGNNANTEEEGEEQEEDEDSEGDISFNDDQMFQLDATLGAYFNSMKNGGNKKITEQERIGRVMRVLTCINVLIKKQSDSPSLLNLPATLLVVLLTARKREILTLVQKTSGLFESLVKCKSVPEARQADELELQLHRALYLASRHEDLQVRRTAIQGYIFLVRASLQNTECERVGKDSLSAAIGDYFDKKKSKLSLQIFQQLLTRVPRLSEIIFPIVLNKCNTARNSFIRGTGIAILEIAVKNASGGLAGILRGVSSDVVQLFLDVISNSVDKVKSSTNVIKAAQRLAQAMKGKGLGLAQIMSHAKAKEALQRLKDAAKNNPKETSLARLVELLETGSLGESNDEDNNNNNKRKKRASQISKQKKARK